MSRFLFTCWPFTGHLLPQISIARALRERGHEVAFYTGEAARRTVESEEFELFALTRVDEDRVTRLVHAIDTGDGRNRPGGGRLIATLRDWLVGTIPDQVDDIRTVMGEWSPDVIATDLSMWAPIIVLWETERIPVALSSTFMGPLIPGPDAPPFGFGLRPPHRPVTRLAARSLTAVTELAGARMRRSADEIRARYGLGPLGESVNRYTGRLPLYLVGNIRELDYGRRDLPASVHYVGNCIWYPESRETAEWLARVPTDRPWIHVTESTLAYGDPFLLRSAITALAHQPVEVIVTTGERDGVSALGPDASAPNIHITRWLSHGELMRRCAVVITVGGKATVLAAMDAGVPMVIVPTTWDKPDNARRVVEAGVGVRLAPRHCTPERLRAAVEHVLGEPRYRENAQRIASLLAAAPGPPGAAALLEGLVEHPQGGAARTPSEAAA